MSAPGADNRDDGPDFHVAKQPLGVGNAHTDTSVRGRGHAKRRRERDLSGFGDLVRDSVEADVAAFATLGEPGHEAHALIWAWRVIRLSRFGKDLEGASGSRVEQAG